MDVVTIGETMALFTPTFTGPMRYGNYFSRKFGGAESNVALGLARLGHQVGWISKLGNDEFGKAIFQFIRGEGIDVTRVKFDETYPTGIYFKEIRRQNDVRIHYYRKGSAASNLTKEDLDAEYIGQAKYLHITGITPALSDSCLKMINYAIDIAKKNEVKIIFDPNLRLKLWSKKLAKKTLLNIASKADFVLPGEEEGFFMFGETNPEVLGKRFIENGAQTVIIKHGAKGASYHTPNETGMVEGFPVDQVVDPVGAGDAFAAGFISGLLNGLTIPESVNRANLIGAFSVTTDGDTEGLPYKDEIDMFYKKNKEDVQR